MQQNLHIDGGSVVLRTGVSEDHRSESTMVEWALPRSDFTATTAANRGGFLYPCRDLWNGYALDDAVLDETPMKDVDWPTLFAYMHRRFGPPHRPGDDYRDLSASWILTTPDPNVFVSVDPSLSGPGFSFSPYLTFASEDDGHLFRTGILPIAADRVAAIRMAYKDTLMDLLRPVGVHDQYINALGEIGDTALEESLLSYDDDKDEPIYEVPYHSSSGYAMPAGLFGGEDWVKMCTLIRHLGHGDITKGRAALIAQLQQGTIDEAAKAPWEVHRLMLLGAWNDRHELGSRLGLDAATIDRFEAEIAAINAKEGRNRSVIDEMTDAAVNAAVDYIDRLAFDAKSLTETVVQYRIDKATDEVWYDLSATVKEGFPEETLPVDAGRLGKALSEALKASFTSHGRDDLAMWVDRALNIPEGQVALSIIVRRLVNQDTKKQKT